MKLWIDDVRPAPEGYEWIASVNEAKATILAQEKFVNAIQELFVSVQNGALSLIAEYEIELIDIDHDAGDYTNDGGDYIKLLNWLEETGRNYPIRIHSTNPVGVENMRRIIKRNGWTEVK